MTGTNVGAQALTGQRLARALGDGHDRLAAFRLRADLDYERSLSTLIESEIIPRLVIAHSADERTGWPPACDTIDPAEAEALAPLALEVEADALLAHVESVLARGVTVETMMVDLLAPAARLLGEYWESDRCDFVEVTMGLWRLQEVIHEIACRIPAERVRAAGGHRALFAAMPGDQHNFGTVVIDEVFRRDGWVTDRICDEDIAVLLKKVAEQWFDLVGLTISCDCHIAQLASIILAVRNVSKNSRVCVMVGGRIFVNQPSLALDVGADGTAGDAKLALRVAEGLVRERECEAVVVS